MVPPADINKPTGSQIFQKLPRLSTSVWLLIILVLVLLAVVPMITAYLDAKSQEGILRAKLTALNSQYLNLQKQVVPQRSVNAEISQLKVEVEAARSIYDKACDTVETSRELINLAWQYDLIITGMQVNSVKGKIQGDEYQGISYVLNLRGQVPNFQNYLIAVSDKFPSSRPDSVTINPAIAEGTLDSAVLTFWMSCNK